jgi:hypothetical protein
MSQLRERLACPETRTRVVEECTSLIHGQIADATGIAGTAVRLAHRASTRMRPHGVREMVDHLLPEFATQLEPWYAPTLNLDEEARKATFREALIRDARAVSSALVGVTDRTVASSKAPFSSIYRGIRATAVEQVCAAVPGLADILARYV